MCLFFAFLLVVWIAVGHTTLVVTLSALYSLCCEYAAFGDEGSDGYSPLCVQAQRGEVRPTAATVSFFFLLGFFFLFFLSRLSKILYTQTSYWLYSLLSQMSLSTVSVAFTFTWYLTAKI